MDHQQNFGLIAKSVNTIKPIFSEIINWLMMETTQKQPDTQRKYPWWQVMCLAGVDYFSTLGYQPGIAALAAGNISPVATLILVLLTICGALPIYRRVATKSPYGKGSIEMLEHLLPWWQGKLLVLCLLGFLATDFIITITLSSADATTHIVENPLIPAFVQHQQVTITLLLVILLGAVFLKGFREAVQIAVFLVATYLLLNLIVLSVSLSEIWHHSYLLTNWKNALFARDSHPWMILGTAILIFPKLALGLSGFETGVTVMPFIQGSRQHPDHLPGRIRSTHKMLTTAAVIMSFFLITSSWVTILLIPPSAFQAGGKANGRALAYLAHQYLGDKFGTIYDISTILILWFAGASAMAGLLNIVPRYLPSYGMAPTWSRAVRPLVLVYTIVALIVTVLFKADVDAQSGAYATGVLVMITSAGLAVTLSLKHLREKSLRILFGVITLLFLYTTNANIIERPNGIKIAAFFIFVIIFVSFISRVWRSTELRVEEIELDKNAGQFLADQSQSTIRLIANRLNAGDIQEYFLKEDEMRKDNHIPVTDTIIFLEVMVTDASEFTNVLKVRGITVGDYRILRVNSVSVPNAIAALLLYIRDQTGKIPHAYFGWGEGNPIEELLRFILFGEGDIPVITHEVLRKAEKNPHLRPAIHIGS